MRTEFEQDDDVVLVLEVALKLDNVLVHKRAVNANLIV